MELDSTDSYLKDNLENIMNGEWDQQFDEQQLEQAKKMSFLLNHITLENRCIVFEYADQKIKYNFDCDPADYSFYGGDFKLHMFSMIKNDQNFLTTYTAFKRDCKINKIIE
jgi:hypothetical protein